MTVRRLLAVDAGIRAGLAVYTSEGRLESWRSTNFGSIRRLRGAVYSVLGGIDGLERIVIEGAGGGIADPWLKEGRRRGLTVVQTTAEEWRRRLVLPRDRRTGAAAKEQADTLARRVIEWSDVPRPTSLRHDAAEAILVGLWGALEADWLPDVPHYVRTGRTRP